MLNIMDNNTPEKLLEVFESLTEEDKKAFLAEMGTQLESQIQYLTSLTQKTI
jgi:Mg/Co/Ni transporter MgtE